ncbi:MAG: DUF1192 family protein [Rhodospirillaceae bacterium]
MAFDTDDLEPMRPVGGPKGAMPRALTDMSIGDLEEYVGELEAEIARVQAEIAAKGKAKAAADALFKKP